MGGGQQDARRQCACAQLASSSGVREGGAIGRAGTQGDRPLFSTHTVTNMTTSKRVTAAKAEQWHKNIDKRGKVRGALVTPGLREGTVCDDAQRARASRSRRPGSAHVRLRCSLPACARAPSEGGTPRSRPSDADAGDAAHTRRCPRRPSRRSRSAWVPSCSASSSSLSWAARCSRSSARRRRAAPTTLQRRTIPPHAAAAPCETRASPHPLTLLPRPPAPSVGSQTGLPQA